MSGRPAGRPRVSVIICCYTFERYDDIREAVTSVLCQSTPAHEVIVVSDHNPELLAALRADLPPATVLRLNEGPRGLSAARNTGVAAATGEVVAFIDDDAVAERTWLAALAAAFDDPAVVGAGGPIVPRWMDGPRPGWFPPELYWIVGCTYRGMPRQGRRVRNVIGCNMAFRAGALRSVGMFHTDVGRVGKATGIGEDSEICLRLTAADPDAVIVFEPAAVVHHKVPAWRVSPRYLLKRSYDEGYYKNVVRALGARASRQPLSTENAYLSYLLLRSIPRRLMSATRPRALPQAAAIALCIAATATGYAAGRLQPRRPATGVAPAAAAGGLQ
jgi:glycosyltransferase involved in cell wall biosynthesis